MEASAISMDDMYEYLAHRLSEANTVSQLTIFIEKLLTVKQLQYDLLSLLDHYYQVANKVNNHRIYSNSNGSTFVLHKNLIACKKKTKNKKSEKKKQCETTKANHQMSLKNKTLNLIYCIN